MFRAGLGFLFTFFLSSIFTTVQVVFIVAKIALIFISLSAVHIDDFIQSYSQINFVSYLHCTFRSPGDDVMLPTLLIITHLYCPESDR